MRTIPHWFSDQSGTMRSRPEGGAAMGVPGPCIVDLCDTSDDDDDDDVVFLGECPAPFSHRASSRKGLTRGGGAVVNTDLVILEEVDKTIEINFGAVRVEKEWQKLSQNSSVVLDDDCCILDEDPDKQAVVKTICDDDSDDLVMTGEVGQVACRDFPHARHLCVQFPFKTTVHTSFCSQCHCYVCDMLAPCSLWGDGTRAGDHCHASDKSGERWKLLRQYNKSHPTGCSNPLSIQQLLSSPENTSAGKSDSGAQRCSYPAGLDIRLVQSKELVAQCVSDLFGSDQGESTISKIFGALASTSSSRGFSQNPPVNTGNSESTSFRGLLGCHTGGSARSQYPLQVSLNRRNRDLSSHPRRHSQGVGVQSKLHKYLPGKDQRYSGVYRSHQSERGGACQTRKVSRRNGSYYTEPPHSSSILERAQAAAAAAAACAAVLGRPCPAPTTAEQDSVGGTVPNGNALSSIDFLGELGISQTLLPFSNPGRTDEMRQQYLNVESASVCPDLNFGNAIPLGQNEADAFNFPLHETGGSSNSVFVEPQSSRESENKLEGRTNYLPTSHSTLLADYLLSSIPDFEWGD